ncbi:phosphoribosylglycinamide formyltransferase [Streptococcus pneumoniae]|nr:phosphoribosylglycinamide formyltransferase [Streptococcus pneumoniae]
MKKIAVFASGNGSNFQVIAEEFPGAHGIEDAWNAGVGQSGVTIHWVDSGVDTGQVIKQVRVPRLADDTIDRFEARIHEAEYRLYLEVVKALFTD